MHPESNGGMPGILPHHLAELRASGLTVATIAAAVTALFNPRRRPSYNGGIERANGQLAGYQEALAECHGRPGMPTCEDAHSAQRLANESTRPDGWRGPTAAELWNRRDPIAPLQRADFLAAVTERRTVVRGEFGFAAAESLNHYAQAAVDRRAVRDALVAHDLLRIHPRRRKRPVALVQFN
jgi:hypothetical protein